MNGSRFVLFLFGMLIIILGWMVTTCRAGHVEETIPTFKDPNLVYVSSSVNVKCIEITPTVFKCWLPDGTTSTIIKL